MLETRTLDRLEFDRIKALLRGNILSEPGQQALDRLSPEPSQERVQELLEQVHRMMDHVRQGLRLDFSRVPPSVPLDKAKARSLLTPPDLLKIRDLIHAAHWIFDALYGTDLQSLMMDPQVLDGLRSAITRTLNDEGEIQDTASPDLARIRKAKREAEKEVLQKMETLKRRYAEQGLLRENFVTLKNGRYVLPLKSHVKIEGVVHGYSSTEETIYIEPLEVIEAQNRLKRREEEERREIERILRELSDQVYRNALFLERLYEDLGNLEVLYAKAWFGLQNDAIVPEIADQPQLILKGARHPLLIVEKGFEGTVPLDLEFRTGILLISGPNAGGKTVALKTVGLLLLMTKAGIPIPAERAILYLPQHLFAIGFTDEQDLLKGESSFTSVIRETKEALEQAQSGDLVLFDELLASTDPSEGAALAFAILKAFQKRGVFVIANTHLGPLKDLVEQAEGMMNASMGYNPITGQPTYHLEVGTPGESRALETAIRVGIPEDIVSEARAALMQFEAGLRRLKRELEEKERALLSLEQELRARQEHIERMAERKLEVAKLQARKILQEVQREAEELRKALKKASRQKEGLKVVSGVRKKVAQKTHEMDVFTRKAEHPIVGKSYRIKPFGWVGEFVGTRDGRYFVRIGKHEIEVSRDALYEL